MKKYKLKTTLLISALLFTIVSFGQQKFEQGFFESDDSFSHRIDKEFNIKVSNILECKMEYAPLAPDFERLNIVVNFNTFSIVKKEDDFKPKGIYEVTLKVYTTDSRTIIAENTQLVFAFNLCQNFIHTDYDSNTRYIAVIDFDNLIKKYSNKIRQEELILFFSLDGKTLGAYRMASLNSLFTQFKQQNKKYFHPIKTY